MRLAVLLGSLLCLALAAALAARLWLRRRKLRRKRRRIARKLKHPVVLAHGLLGVQRLEVAGRRHEYFKEAEALARMGAVVHRPQVPLVAGIEARAAALAECIRALPDARVNIVAHSMGGLDARYAIARLGIAGKVASLVTVGTPHRGTPLADVGVDFFGEKLGLKRALDAIGLDVNAFYDLTTARMTAFNKKVKNARRVDYASVVAAIPAAGRVSPLLWPTHKWLAQKAGRNDGLVPADSQRWGEVLAEVEADHWAQIGWSKGYDAAGLFELIANELKARGF